MITESLYQRYLALLLNADRRACVKIVQQLLKDDIDIQTLYHDLFQKSMYEVGRLWEFNRISVAREHLVTAITEGLLNLVYSRLFEKASIDSRNEKKVVISCAANEFHQVGGKMVADICEAHAYAERIRQALPEKDLLQNGHPIFASFGVSQLLPDETSAGLIKRADTALYQAKTSGRNRTVPATGNGAGA